jgi:type VI secretion system ImpM family protein
MRIDPLTAYIEAPGWFGKLPAMGDFIQRRLSDGFVRPWDAWLASGVHSVKQRHGERADEMLLTFPVWQFMIPRRLIDEDAWIGVLLPSVDRVGRCFPLTIAQPLKTSLFGTPTLLAVHEYLQPWVQAALNVLEDDNLVQFEDKLMVSASTQLDVAGPEAPEQAESLDKLMIALGSRLATGHMAGESLWWTGARTLSATTASGHNAARLLRWPGALDSELLLELLRAK